MVVKKKPIAKTEKKAKPIYKGMTTKVTKIELPPPTGFNVPPEDISEYTFLIHGAKGIGKSTAASTFPGNLTFMWEPFRRNLPMRMVPLQVKRAREIEGDEDDPWCQFIEYLSLAVSDNSVKTITQDSVDLCWSACQEHICRMNNIDNPSDKNDFGKTWNEIKFTFQSVFNTVKSHGKQMIFISHSKERDQEILDAKGQMSELSLIAPSCAPACTKIMKEVCDFWFYYGKDIDTQKRKVILRDPTNQVDVACGCGFLDSDGEPIQAITIPNDPKSFFTTINAAFKGATPRVPVKKKTPVRKLPK